MEKPKTWLSAIVRPNAVYIQAYIFSVQDRIIYNKKLTLKNIEDNTSVEFELIEETNGTCLFKNNQKLNLLNSTNYKLELVITIFNSESDSYDTYTDIDEFITPAVWDNANNLFNLSISKEMPQNKTSVEPNIKVAISGNDIPNGSTLFIIGSYTFPYNLGLFNYDVAKQFDLDGTQQLFENTFKLTTSGFWNFKAILKLPNNSIFSSEAVSHTVYQGDIFITEIVEEVSLLKLQTGQVFNTNQMIGTKRVGVYTINEGQTIQKGTFYEFHVGEGKWYPEYAAILKSGAKRLPTKAELYDYLNIKDILIGVEPVMYYCDELGKAIGFHSNGVPYDVTLEGWDLNHTIRVNYLILEDFENNIATADPLVIPVFNGGLNIQPSGIKITELVKNSDLKGYINVNALTNPIKLWSITVDPELGYDNAEIPNYDPYRRFFYYNEAEKMLYYRWIEMTPGAWLPYQAPSTDAIYTFNGDKYMWNGTNLININLGNSNVNLDSFEDANY